MFFFRARAGDSLAGVRVLDEFAAVPSEQTGVAVVPKQDPDGGRCPASGASRPLARIRRQGFLGHQRLGDARKRLALECQRIDATYDFGLGLVDVRDLAVELKLGWVCAGLREAPRAVAEAASSGRESLQ